jgi:hypothetical protein
MIATVARQGFALCSARDRSASEAVGPAVDRSLEPLLPGFVTVSAAMGRVVEQIQRMQANDLTVLITGGGTGRSWSHAPSTSDPTVARRSSLPQLHDDRAGSGGQSTVRPSS